jgi:hypothetical protein
VVLGVVEQHRITVDDGREEVVLLARLRPPVLISAARIQIEPSVVGMNLVAQARGTRTGLPIGGGRAPIDPGWDRAAAGSRKKVETAFRAQVVPDRACRCHLIRSALLTTKLRGCARHRITVNFRS